MNNVTRAILTFILIIGLTTTVYWSNYIIFGVLLYHRLIATLFALGSRFCQFINYVQFELAKHCVGLWEGATIAIITYVTTAL